MSSVRLLRRWKMAAAWVYTYMKIVIKQHTVEKKSASIYLNMIGKI